MTAYHDLVNHLDGRDLDAALCTHGFLARSTAGSYRVPQDTAEAHGHAKRPILAVLRAKCLDCCGGQAEEVRRCPCPECPLWPYRMGANPFHGR